MIKMLQGLKNYWMFILVIAIFAGGWTYLSYYHPCHDERGTFGDQFGFINTIFSGLAFAGLIFTIMLQKKELALQRQELADNREEMKRQTEQFVAQNNNLEIQRFENTFFNMLEQLQQIVNSLSFSYREKIKEKETTPELDIGYKEKIKNVERHILGRDLFHFAFSEAVHHTGDGKQVKGLGKQMQVEGFSAYTTSYTPTYFDHYFRFMYTILAFIHHNKWLGHDKQYQYAKMLRATLSRYELVWLFYNGLSEYGRDKLKPLIEEYTLLKNLRPDLLTICKENYSLLQEKDIVKEYELEYWLSDYEFCMTMSEIEDKEKYSLSAFYSHDKVEEGRTLLKGWQDYMQRHGLTP